MVTSSYHVSIRLTLGTLVLIVIRAVLLMTLCNSNSQNVKLTLMSAVT
jgi:hypothetical protein